MGTRHWYRMTLPLTSQKIPKPTGRLLLFSLCRDLSIRALSFLWFQRWEQLCLARLTLLPGLRVPDFPCSSALCFISCPFSLVGWSHLYTSFFHLLLQKSQNSFPHLPSSLLDTFLERIVCISAVIHLFTHYTLASTTKLFLLRILVTSFLVSFQSLSYWTHEANDADNLLQYF